MARGVAPSVFSFDINPTQAIPGRSSAPEFFRRQQQIQGGYVRNRPSFWGNLFKAGTVCEFLGTR